MGIVYADQVLLKAKSAAKRGRLEEASALYMKILETFPQNRRALEGLVVVHDALLESHKLSLLALYKNGHFDVLAARALGIAEKVTHSVFLWNILGLAFAAMRRFEESMTAFNNALSVQAEDFDTFYNIGNTMQSLGRFEEAIGFYQKALELKPDNAEACRNMGLAFQALGRPSDALASFRMAVSFDPRHADAYNDMGNALSKLNQPAQTLYAYQKALELRPDFPEASRNLGLSLRGVIFERRDPAFLETVETLLNHNTLVRPRDISKAAISLLKKEPAMQSVLLIPSKTKTAPALTKRLEVLAGIPLLSSLMRVCPLDDAELEALLVEIRSALLLRADDINASADVLSLQSALAQQCFINEYIYPQSARETAALNDLEQSAESKLAVGEQPSTRDILCLACYRPLHHYAWCNQVAVDDDIKPVLDMQVSEPLYERRLKDSIERFGNITDKVSLTIRQQYEENPYPRWVRTGLPLKASSLAQFAKEQRLSLVDAAITSVKIPNILVAGCGTGQHAISVASRFANANVLAVDLSLSSLAYARRKAEELAIGNLRLMHADILELDALEGEFDIVECAGVLHHLKDPEAGWKTLTGSLRQGGLMKIALYSETARKDVVVIRKEIEELGLSATAADMVSFRHHIMTSPLDHHRRMLSSTDFYSLGEFRDLLFNFQEHHFTLPQIKACIDLLGLHFCGFETSPDISRFRLIHTSRDDANDLDKWHAFENDHPATFNGMYQFWCQKTG